jgi:hypothetical protein
MLPAPAASRIGLLLTDVDDSPAPRRSHARAGLSLLLAGFLVAALHIALRSGSIDTPRTRLAGGVAATQRHDGHEDSRMELTQKLGAAAGAVALSLGASALAQDAVQWRVEDGGNGHWYAAVATQSPISWSAARDAAALRGGHLATLTSQGEDLFVSAIALGSPTVWPIEDRYGPWLGGYQPKPAADPNANWMWVTGEPWTYVSDLVQFDNSWRPDGQRDDYLHYIDHSRIWNDVREDGDTYYGIGIRSYIVEWSTDCNSDGIVDFGQILAGELDDANRNNIPDCCEGAGSCNCPGDVARDGVVNGIDLAAVLNNWGTGGGAINADANGDGIVDAEDLALVLGSWGECP